MSSLNSAIVATASRLGVSYHDWKALNTLSKAIAFTWVALLPVAFKYDFVIAAVICIVAFSSLAGFAKKQRRAAAKRYNAFLDQALAPRDSSYPGW
jgi:hypothetical protein